MKPDYTNVRIIGDDLKMLKELKKKTKIPHQAIISIALSMFAKAEAKDREARNV